jgi:uncharacterized membrane protein YidH (DUF202 family)
MFWTGMVLGCIGGLWLSINAFRTAGALWGLGALIVPFVAQLHGLRNLDDNTVPLILSLPGVVLCVLGYGGFAAAPAAP